MRLILKIYYRLGINLNLHMCERSQGFSLSLKIGGEFVRFTIQNNQDKDQVFERLVKLYPHYGGKKEVIMRKVFENLEHQIEEGRLTSRLQSSIKEFLRKNNLDYSVQTQNVSVILDYNNSQIHSKNNISIKSCQAKPKEIIKIQAKPKKINHPESNNKYSPSVNSNQRHCINYKNLNKVSNSKKSQKKVSCNPDIIKACEVIMKKATHNDMKAMARQFLKQKGFLKEQKQIPLSHMKRLLTHQNNPGLSNQTGEQLQESKIDQCQRQSNQFDQQSLETIKPVEKVIKNYPRLSKYKYLQSSFTNESILNKQYDCPSLISDSKPRRYSYLND